MLIRLGALVLIGALLFVFHGIRYYSRRGRKRSSTGSSSTPIRSTGQKETTVVLFREENLQQLKELLPGFLQASRHGAVGRARVALSRARFSMDFVFMDKRDGIGKLAARPSAMRRRRGFLFMWRDPAHGGSGQGDAAQPWLSMRHAGQRPDGAGLRRQRSPHLRSSHRLRSVCPCRSDAAAGDKNAGDKGVRHKDTVVEKDFLTTPAALRDGPSAGKARGRRETRHGDHLGQWRAPR